MKFKKKPTYGLKGCEKVRKGRKRKGNVLLKSEEKSSQIGSTG